VALAQDVPSIALPVSHLFPGAVNPDITPEDINQKICMKGWSTKSIRPPSSYTTALKNVQLRTLDCTLPNLLPAVLTASGRGMRPDIQACVPRSSNPACYEEDHLISLELGGHPRSPNNLWPEPRFGDWNARVKDRLENKLHDLVCSGEIGLREAQKAIAPIGSRRVGNTWAEHRETGCKGPWIAPYGSEALQF
jgi:hypothetical protein